MLDSSGMRLVLTYSGPLPPNGNSQEKHNIRKVFHPQLRQQWAIDPALVTIANTVEDAGTGLEMIANTFRQDRFRFIPLVTNKLKLVCSLEIVLFRKEDPGRIVQQGGDIDNRVKTLFDSLSYPIRPNQVQGLVPERDEEPFYCLLEDDSLITGFQIKTERLLEPVGANPDDVRLLITAVICPTTVTGANMGFLGGWL